jgi:TetR/AcrR family transcriptional regulator, regulator of autoinduction and epiphytic fitness
MAVQLSDQGAQRRESVTTEGRVLRGERNREAIVDALLALFEEGHVSPTSREIAERSGVSLRTVFQHFNDMEALCAAVSQRQIDRIWSHLDPLPGCEESLEVRIDGLVAQRSQLFEMIAPTRRAAVHALDASPTLMRGLARSEAFLRRQVIELFAAELATEDSDRIAAVDFAASWEAWDGLRRASRHSVERASHIMRTMLLSLLTLV